MCDFFPMRACLQPNCQSTHKDDCMARKWCETIILSIYVFEDMIVPCFLLLLLVLESLVIFIAGQSPTSKLCSFNDPIYRPNNDFYQRYSHYPEYCSTPQQIDERRIPPLRDDHITSIGETRLIHVTSVIRHGARTPWSANVRCWDGYWEDVKTGIWDCDLTTFMTQPDAATEKRNDQRAMFLFEKQYDSIQFREDHLTNELNGTCQMGQLLYQGYDQQLKIGKILRDAYTFRKGEFDKDERMRLIDLSLQDYIPWHSDHLLFRADDDQRTIMSGSVLLRSLFETELEEVLKTTNHYPVISLHIADRDRDIVDANDRDCPRLVQIQLQATQSPDYQVFDNSQSSQNVRSYMLNNLKIIDETQTSILDCLMCTMCTDRPLPEAVNDYDGTNDNWFTRLAQYDIQTYTKVMKFNDSQYAKLALGPLWYEIMQNINLFLEGSSDGQDLLQVEVNAPKLALFSGHDTTIMPLLASLGTKLWNDTDWAPYASMMVIELHELIDGHSDAIYSNNIAFRLIYNGKILTSLVEGCPEAVELCDIVHFKSIVDSFATRTADCSLLAIATEDVDDEILSIEITGDVVFFIVLVFSSGWCGGYLTFVIARSYYARHSGRSKVNYDGGMGIEDNNYELEMQEVHKQGEPTNRGRNGNVVNG
jgi:hypothetical protein